MSAMFYMLNVFIMLMETKCDVGNFKPPEENG